MIRAPRLKLAPSIVLASAAAILIAGVAVALYGQHVINDQKVREIAVQADILAASVAAPLDFNDNQTAQEYVNALKANPELQVAAVYNATGVLVASYVREAAFSLPRAPRIHAPSLEDDGLVVVTAVVQDNRVVGTVYLRTAVDPLIRRLLRYGVIILFVSMGALVLAMFASSQEALTRANRELERRAADLVEANRNLHDEMAERAKTEEALRQSQKMEAIGQLSGGIAHDFNNLLTVIKGNLQLLQRRIGEGKADVGKYVESATEGLNRAAVLTQRILAFSRRQPLSPQPVDLNELIRNMSELLRHALGERAQIETHLEADWWILCDRNQMESVILNLANNARDAMPDGGKFILETANANVSASSTTFEGISRGDYVRFTLRDTGDGMSDEVRCKAIDPFFTTKPQGKGTGLGLSMSFGYIRQSNGYFEIDSEVGKGTTITIMMPKCDAETSALRA